MKLSEAVLRSPINALRRGAVGFGRLGMASPALLALLLLPLVPPSYGGWFPTWLGERPRESLQGVPVVEKPKAILEVPID